MENRPENGRGKGSFGETGAGGSRVPVRGIDGPGKPVDLPASDRPERKRGAFFTAGIPKTPTPLNIHISLTGEDKTFQVQFTKEELEYIKRAREAIFTSPEILQSMAEASHVRPVTSSLRILWGGGLVNRERALNEMQYADEAASIVAEYHLSDGIDQALKTMRENLLPFLPPEEPSVNLK